MSQIGAMKGMRVVVTGASRGVGFEVAQRFLIEGAQVLGIARNRANLAHADRRLKAFGRSWATLLADVADPRSATRIASAVKRRWGALDLLLNNAGVSPGGHSFATEREGDLERTLAVNVLAVHRLTRALLPLLRKGRRPRVVNVSSGAGNRHSIETSGGMSSYRASKWALNGVTRLWANELKGRVSVIMMDPGWVKTDMGGPSAPDSPTLSAQRAVEIALLPHRVTGTYQAGKREGGW